MYSLSVAPDAQKDLEEIWRTSRTAAARIVVFLEQLKADPGLLDVLLVHDFGARQTAAFSVQKIQSLWNARRYQGGRDLWRLKLWDLERQGLPYRIIYAYEIRAQRYHVLGVIHHQGFNYEPDHPFTKRVVRAYDELCG